MQAQPGDGPSGAHWAPLLTLQLFPGFLQAGRASSHPGAGTGEGPRASQMTPIQRGWPFSLLSLVLAPLPDLGPKGKEILGPL